MHPDLRALYTDHGGLCVGWELDPEYGGQLWILPPDEQISQGDPNCWGDWSDEEVLHCAIGKHSDPENWLPILRSLVPFHDFGDGERLCVSRLDRTIYYHEHEEGELIYVADNLADFYQGWSKVRFMVPTRGWRDVGLLGGFSEQLFDLPDEPSDLAEVHLKDIVFRTTRKLSAVEVRQFEHYFETHANLVQLKKYLESGHEIALVRRTREDKLGKHIELLHLIDAHYRVVDSDFGEGFADTF